MTRARTHSGSENAARRGFTLAEIMVVIAILALLIGLAVPAFNSILGGTERTLADNQVRAALSAGRDAAIRSEGGDGAAVFLFTPGGRFTVIACVSVGQIEDRVTDAAGTVANRPWPMRDVFVPMTAVEPVTLPRGWSVRGYAPPGSITGGTERSGWYETLEAVADEGAWVFPEDSFIDPDDAAIGTKGWYRQSFMVRFKAGTGSLDTANTTPSLVLLPLNITGFRGGPPWSEARADQVVDLAGFARRVLGRVPSADQRKILGDLSPDTVLARPVTEIALYQEARLARDIRARLNPVTGTLYANPNPPGSGPGPAGPTLDPGALPAGMNADETARAITRWIEGRFRATGATEFAPSDARILTLQRYLGQAQEVRP